MQFEVNGQDYFLNFVPQAGRWFVFKPTRFGVAAMPVVDDEPAADESLSPVQRETIN